MALTDEMNKRPSGADKRIAIAKMARKKRAARLTGVLAAFVVLCTAWALMVPALSITQDAAQPNAGFYQVGANPAHDTLAAGASDPSDTAAAGASTASDSATADVSAGSGAPTIAQTAAPFAAGSATVR